MCWCSNSALDLYLTNIMLKFWLDHSLFWLGFSVMVLSLKWQGLFLKWAMTASFCIIVCWLFRIVCLPFYFYVMFAAKTVSLRSFVLYVQDSFENVPPASSVDTWHHGILKFITRVPQLPYTSDLQVLQTHPSACGGHSYTAETLWKTWFYSCWLHVSGTHSLHPCWQSCVTKL